MDVTRSGVLLKIAGATKANVVVPVRGRIVQIEVKSTCIARVVPIAAADKTAL